MGRGRGLEVPHQPAQNDGVDAVSKRASDE
jgi:hypothetical protein